MEAWSYVAVCGHPVLYDTAAGFYQDQIKKDEAWAKVCEEVELCDCETPCGLFLLHC